VFLLPIIGIVVALLLGYSPTFTAGVGVVATILASMILKETRLSPWQIVEGLGTTTLQILPVAGACAAAALVIGGLSMTGLGMKSANVILEISNARWYRCFLNSSGPSSCASASRAPRGFQLDVVKFQGNRSSMRPSSCRIPSKPRRKVSAFLPLRSGA
jgi:hypothetical protein